MRLNQAELEAALGEAKRELDRARSDLADAQDRIETFAKTVAGLEAWLARLTGHAGSKAEPDGVWGASGPSTATPNGYSIIRPREAILRLTDEEPRVWTLPEFARAMRDRSWLDPNLRQPMEAIRAAANKLADQEHVLRRIGRSSYMRGDGQSRPGRRRRRSQRSFAA
jgi:hypothetical protein